MASTGAWKGHAKWCFHNVFNTTLSRYWNEHQDEVNQIELNQIWKIYKESPSWKQEGGSLHVVGWSVVLVWTGSMSLVPGGWRGGGVGQRGGSGCCLPAVRLPSSTPIAAVEQTAEAHWTWQGRVNQSGTPSGHYSSLHWTLWKSKNIWLLRVHISNMSSCQHYQRVKKTFRLGSRSSSIHPLSYFNGMLFNCFWEERHPSAVTTHVIQLWEKLCNCCRNQPNTIVYVEVACHYCF